jgi:hypothetical protein
VTLAESIEAAWRDYLRSQRHSGAQTRSYLWASGRRDCIRRMALDLLHPEDQEAFTDETLGRFKRGEEREAAVVAFLMQIGPRASRPFQVVGGQERFEIRDRDGTLLLVGRTDGRLQFADSKERPVFEIKSGRTIENVETLEDLGKSKWTSHHLDQLLAYLLANNEPLGLFILDRPGVPTILEVRLEDHLERAEAFLQEARIAIDARFGRAPLPPFTDQPALCRECPHFGKSCAPPVNFGEGLKILTEPRLVLLAELIASKGEDAKSVEKAKEELKKITRGQTETLCGPLIIRGKTKASTKYEIPDEVKQQYAKYDPEGQWVTTFEPHGVTD